MWTGCGKQAPVAAAPPAPAPAPAPPPPEKPSIVRFQVEPRQIEQGSGATLSWQVDRAYEVHIDPDIGLVQPGGSAKIHPRQSTTYVLLAKGPGGDIKGEATVTVRVPPPAPDEGRDRLRLEQIADELKDVYFDYNKSDLRPDGVEALNKVAEVLKRTGIAVLIEGHCDERGSAEYNLAMGDRRAQTVKSYLMSLGVAEAQLATVSYGKENPQCFDATEQCWQLNRRAHFTPRVEAAPSVSAKPAAADHRSGQPGRRRASARPSTLPHAG
jgi:peptidoglycan-associated lipoprotein